MAAGPGGAVQRRVGSAWRRRGGEIREGVWLGEDKGDVVDLSDTARGQGELAVDDQNLAAPSGHRHAEIGMVQSMPEQALWRLSPLGAQN